MLGIPCSEHTAHLSGCCQQRRGGHSCTARATRTRARCSPQAGSGPMGTARGATRTEHVATAGSLSRPRPASSSTGPEAGPREDRRAPALGPAAWRRARRRGPKKARTARQTQRADRLDDSERRPRCDDGPRNLNDPALQSMPIASRTQPSSPPSLWLRGCMRQPPPPLPPALVADTLTCLNEMELEIEVKRGTRRGRFKGEIQGEREIENERVGMREILFESGRRGGAAPRPNSFAGSRILRREREERENREIISSVLGCTDLPACHPTP
jgi:hypothetical protein